MALEPCRAIMLCKLFLVFQYFIHLPSIFETYLIGKHKIVMRSIYTMKSFSGKWHWLIAYCRSIYPVNM